MAESRRDYLNWINSLLGLRIEKIEDLGKGDVFCQVFNSIFLDVPLKKVKINPKHEFEFIANFKVLQTVFDKHKIPNQINIEKLVKLRFQDNFEFCQFAKKFWDAHFSGHAHDAVGRRSGMVSNATLPKLSSGLNTAVKVKSNHDDTLYRNVLQENELLQMQAQEAQTHLITMEKERDFYYNKLRQVEVLLQQAQEKNMAQYYVKDLLSVLYATDESFACPTDPLCASATALGGAPVAMAAGDVD